MSIKRLQLPAVGSGQDAPPAVPAQGDFTIEPRRALTTNLAARFETAS